MARLAPFKPLILGWGAGATLLGLFLFASHICVQARMPAHLNAISEEIYARRGTNQIPKAGFSAVMAPIESGTTNQKSERLDYYLVPPARMDAHKKYPALVDQTSSGKHDHARDIQLLANAGIFYVSPNSIGITKWGVVPKRENTLAVYAELLKNPNVDPNRIYICGQSITTITACSILEENPKLWRGLVLLEPVNYPKILSTTRDFPSVFISIGLSDRYNEGGIGPGKAEKFLQEASRHFVSTRIDYQVGDHGYQPEQLQAAYKALIKFILTDY